MDLTINNEQNSNSIQEQSETQTTPVDVIPQAKELTTDQATL